MTKLTWVLAGLAALALTLDARAETKLKALIIDGQNNHDWRGRRRC